MADYVRNDNLVIQRGDDRGFFWALLDGEGNPLDTAGYTAVAEIRPPYRSSTPLHRWTSEAGSAVLTEGAVTLDMSGSEEWDWTFGTFVLQVSDTEDKTEVISQGTATLIDGVSA